MPEPFENADQDRLKHIYKTTDVRRLPMTGIVAGYHALPAFLSDRFRAAGGTLLLEHPVRRVRWIPAKPIPDP